MLNNRDRRNGLIIQTSAFSQANRKSYGRLNKGTKARYNLNDLVHDMDGTSKRSSAEGFDISTDSFKLSDDEYEGPVMRRNMFDDDDDEDADGTFGNLGDLNDVPYGMTQVISVAISDNEDSDATMETPEKQPRSAKRNSHQLLLESTPVKNPPHVPKKSKPVLQESNVLPNTTLVNDKRASFTQQQHPPVLQRQSSSNLRNRSSVNSKRWSLLSFNSDMDKENVASVKSKRFSMASVQSTSSKDKSKRFSIASTMSTNSSSSSSFRNAVVTKVGNVLSSVSVNSGDGSADSTPYKSVRPGVVGESETQANSTKRSSGHGLTSPVAARQNSQASVATTNVTVTSSYQNKRTQEYSRSTQPQPPTSASSMRIPSDNSDQISMVSMNSSLKSSRSRFRLSSLFTSSKKDFGDDESVRSLRARGSLSDMRKSVLSLSQSRTSLFRLTKKESLQDLKRKPSLDKSMISMPKPDTDSASRLKNKLRNSSSILSIGSVVSRQHTVVSTANHSNSTANSTSLNSTSMNSTSVNTTLNNTTTAMTEIEYEDTQLKNLLDLSDATKVQNFQEYITQLPIGDDEVLVKFAEASYSEVFVVKDLKKSKNCKILKVIPFGEDGEDQSTLENVLQELKICKKLSGVDGFIAMDRAVVVQGEYPTLLMKLWDDFQEVKGSVNGRPEYPADQKFLVMELEYGGTDLEKFEMSSWQQGLDIFWQVVRILDRAERLCKFEHRDLHWGNVVVDCVSKSQAVQLEEAFQDLSIVEEEEVEKTLVVKLIDYTLSRLDGDNDEVIFTRLDHQDFFKGRGDYQFDIYRFMRNELKGTSSDDADWSASSFKNNLYWLHYLLDKIINAKGLRGTDKAQKDLEYLYKSLDPRRKKLNSGDASFKRGGQKSKKNKKRGAVYFQDFDSCADVLKFGEFYRLI